VIYSNLAQECEYLLVCYSSYSVGIPAKPSHTEACSPNQERWTESCMMHILHRTFILVGIQADGCSPPFSQSDSICPISFRRRSTVPKGLHRMPRHGRKHPTASEFAEILVWSTILLCVLHFDNRLFLTWRLIMPGSHSFPEGSREVTCHMANWRICCGLIAHCYWRKGGKLAAEMELPQRRNCITSRTTGKGGCRWVKPSGVAIFAFFN
jgi:hypothetical protein